MRRRGREPALREAVATGRHELALYVAAGTVYVAIGVSVPEFLFSGLVAVAFVVIFVVALPALARRLFR